MSAQSDPKGELRQGTVQTGVLGSLLLLFGGCILGGLMAEAAVRIYASASDSWVATQLDVDPYGILVEPFGSYGYRPKPGAVFHYDNGTAATMNSMGYRGPEVAVPKPEGAIRIVLLGGSTTHGWGVDDQETVDAHMRRMLRARHPDTTVQVVNLAFDGYDSYQLLERLRHDVLPLEPDFIVVNTGINDVRNGRFPGLTEADPRTILWKGPMERLREEQRRGGPSMWTRAKHHLYLARVPGVVRGTLSQTAESRDVDRSGAPYRDALEYYERNLMRIAELASENGALLFLATHPSSLSTKYEPDDTSHRSYWIRDAETTQLYRDSLDTRLRRAARRSRERGWPVVALPPTELGPDHFLDDAHLTPAGNRRLAKTFVDALSPYLGDGARDPRDLPSNPEAPFNG